MKKLTLVATSVLVAACAPRAVVTTAEPPTSSPTPPPARIEVRATAMINDVSNTTIGSATFSDTPSGLLVTITVSGLGIGLHGAHLHSVGSCVTPTFMSAGPHFNPGNRQHGFRNASGAHAGDMPNIISPPAGAHRVQFLLGDVKLTGRGGLLDDDGASVVIHSAEDDHISDPGGNSGGRFACGVINPAK